MRKRPWKPFRAALDLEHDLERNVEQLLARNGLADADDTVQESVEVDAGLHSSIGSVSSRPRVEYGKAMRGFWACAHRRFIKNSTETEGRAVSIAMQRGGK
jgi:hypothetical protein